MGKLDESRSSNKNSREVPKSTNFMQSPMRLISSIQNDGFGNPEASQVQAKTTA